MSAPRRQAMNHPGASTHLGFNLVGEHDPAVDDLHPVAAKRFGVDSRAGRRAGVSAMTSAKNKPSGPRIEKRGMGNVRISHLARGKNSLRTSCGHKLTGL
jgi:hypothetical protein